MAAAARSAFNLVLFTEPVSRRNTFVGGTYAPPSAILVSCVVLWSVVIPGRRKSSRTCHHGAGATTKRSCRL